MLWNMHEYLKELFEKGDLFEGYPQTLEYSGLSPKQTDFEF